MDNKLPQDPYMLLSMVNMKLRDQYSSLQEMCDDMQLDCKQLQDTLHQAGFDYMPETNSFR